MSAYFIDSRENIKTVLVENVSLDGNLSFETSLEIRGNFKGTIRGKGLLVIEKNAVIDGNIYVKDLIIKGRINGDLVVCNKLSAEDEAQIFGNIRTHKIKVTNQVTIDGECSTLDIDKMQDIFERMAPDHYFRDSYQPTSPSLSIDFDSPLATSSDSENTKNKSKKKNKHEV